MAGRHLLVTKAGVLGDGFGDGVVEAPVEGLELIRSDGRIRGRGELRDGLADLPVVVDDLTHGVVQAVERRAMLGGASRRPGSLRAGRGSERARKAVEKERHPARQLELRGLRRDAPGDLRTGESDELLA